MQKLNPTRRVGRPQNNAPGRVIQAPEVIPADRLTGVAVNPVAGQGRRKLKKRRKRGQKAMHAAYGVILVVCY